MVALPVIIIYIILQQKFIEGVVAGVLTAWSCRERQEDTMKSLVLYGAKDIRFREDPEPGPGPDEDLVKVSEVGICGSDLHWFDEADIGTVKFTSPCVLGHEIAGEILSGKRRGERVAVDPAISCGECRYCKEGNPNLCLGLRFAGDGITSGGLSERIAWPSRCLVPLPDKISGVEGAMLEPLGIALYAMDLSFPHPGMRIGVLGCGPIGLLLVQLAVRSGAIQVIATDRLPHRVQAARDYGATNAYQVQGNERDQEVWEATHGEGCDIVFEVSGDPAAVNTSLNLACRGARILLVGIPVEDRTSFRASTARSKGLTFQEVRRSKNTYPRAVRLVEQGQVDVATLVTSRFSFSRSLEAFELADRREGIKTVVTFQ
jgi:L-iditol 2-dehydrogenase